ncbi:uncharacterized protein MICPUCDRAFT_69487 [Micromonas pusilla CCMP1545]|uniref:Predicted protein n=1 Tax=Micromonas pusilla (strain CCMP1545) TaxID=564608 RepID=C1MU93_MICPC|nr:uncharacterized protein MICPUCDRAFT_69487 [Micromonas pusilla CCMP1545]EEH56287.1 predicted protein [Micromonas pusilla CCMP1545]|eukprot:XP_003059155.1 predicted protein [Micromonas pusilla CCMP1545]
MEPRASPFYDGDVAGAIALARAHNVPLLVALHGGDDASARLDETWTSETSEVSREIRGETRAAGEDGDGDGDREGVPPRARWVALRLDANTTDYANFVKLFPTSSLPAVVVIDPSAGSTLARLEGEAATSDAPDDLLAALTACREAHERRRSTAALATALAATAAATPAPPSPPAVAEVAEVAEVAAAPPPAPPPPPPPPPVAPPPPPPPPPVGKSKRELRETPPPKRAPSPPPLPRRPIDVRCQVKLPNGATITTPDLPPSDVTTIRDVRRAIEPDAASAGVTAFELWTTWPRARVDERGGADARTLDAAGLGPRPSLMVVGVDDARRRRQRGEAALRPRPAVSAGGGGGVGRRANAAAAGGPLAIALEILRRIWATVSMFLGLNEAPPLRGGERAERGDDAARGGGGGERRWSRSEAVAASNAARAFAFGDGGASSPPPSASAPRRAPGGGAAGGNVHTLGSSRERDERRRDGDDGRNAFWNGNSTVWGGDESRGGGSDDGDDARG